PCRNLTELGITLRAAFACHISSKPACTRCRVRVRLDGGNRKSHRKGLSSGGTNTSCPPILTRAEPVISQSTNRSTKCDVLYDLRVLRQPPRTCKSLFHTVEVTGSNPVAPTIRINHLQIIWVIGVAPGCSNCSAMCLKTLRDRRSPSVRIAPGAAAITPP